MIRRSVLGLAILTIGATGCAGAVAGPGPSPGLPHPVGGSEIVLRVQTGGGFVAPSTLIRQIPEFSLYGDGRAIAPGPQVAVYPGPALVNLQTIRLTEAGVQAILEAARAAGLSGPDHHYATMTISDAPTTTFTLVSDGRRHTISVYALGDDAGSSGMSGDERRARAVLSAFQQKLSNVATWLPSGSVGSEQDFVPAGLRVFVSPGAPPQDIGLREPVVDWPLATPLGSFGAPSNALPNSR